MTDHPSYSAFTGESLLRSGSLASVLATVKLALDAAETPAIFIFDDSTGKAVDFDFRGSLEDVLERAKPAEPAKGPGRPKLGVESREITLLPRHWSWLQKQPSGASAALRRLVEEASRRDPPDQTRARRDAAYYFMSAMAGDRPGFEEASRALFAGERIRLETLTEPWPADISAHLFRLLGAAPVDAVAECVGAASS